MWKFVLVVIALVAVSHASATKTESEVWSDKEMKDLMAKMFQRYMELKAPTNSEEEPAPQGAAGNDAGNAWPFLGGFPPGGDFWGGFWGQFCTDFCYKG